MPGNEIPLFFMQTSAIHIRWDNCYSTVKFHRTKPIRDKGASNYKVEKNQSIENAGVAFVKGTNKRIELLWKNKQTVMYDEQVRTNKFKD